jgi:hypothetical protein
MADVLFVLILVAFFALAVLFVRACDRIIGADTDVVGTTDDVTAGDTADEDRVAA